MMQFQGFDIKSQKCAHWALFYNNDKFNHDRKTQFCTPIAVIAKILVVIVGTPAS